MMRRDDDGLSLIEVLIAMVLSAMIIGVVVTALVTSLSVARSTTDLVTDSSDAGLISSFLVRDAQSAGATDPMTAVRDSTLGVSNDPLATPWADCTPPTSFVLRFGWIDRTVPVSLIQPGPRVVVYYTFDLVKTQLTRRICRSGTATDVVLGSHIQTATASLNATSVSLTLTGSGTRAPLAYTLKAALRGDIQTTPTVLNSSQVPLLSLGPDAACPNVDLSGKPSGVITVQGTAQIDGSCGATPISGIQSLLLPTAPGVTTVVSGMVDPFAGRQPPVATCVVGGTNPATFGVSATRDTITAYPQKVTVPPGTVFQPGRYIFCNGVDITGGQVTGTDLLWYVKAGTMTLAAAATVDLTGRASGVEANMLVWVATPQTVALNGGLHVSSLRGVIYAPTSTLQLSSLKALNVGGVIAKDIAISGVGKARLGLPAAAVAVTPATLPAGQAYVAYTSTTLKGTAATVNSASATGLPAGLTISAAGVISGTPTASGTFTVVATVFDATAVGASMDYTLTIAPKKPYFDTIMQTTGLVSYWRLGEPSASVSSDTFTGNAGATLQTHAGEIASTWAKPVGTWADAVLTSTTGRIRKNGASTVQALYYSSAVPATADYAVEADVYVTAVPLPTNDAIGVVGRLDPTVSPAAYYSAFYELSSQKWTLAKSTAAGGFTWIGQGNVQALAVGTYRLTLDMSGSTIRLLVNGVQQLSVVDATITAPGRGGVILGWNNQGTTDTDTSGMQLDNFAMTTTIPPIADSKGTTSGTYVNAPTLGVSPGAITGDANTAATFDGVSEYGTMARPATIGDDFSIEFWFKSTQVFGTTCTSWLQGAGLVDASVVGTTNDFGIALCAGKVVAGVGNPDISFASAAGFNNGVWHQVVFTRTKATGAVRLYIDAVLKGTITGNVNTLNAAASINLGRLQSGSNYFAGSLDEVSVYSTVLDAATVTAHFNAST
jgi:type II secretory pathway pseudopilin PulG